MWESVKYAWHIWRVNQTSGKLAKLLHKRYPTLDGRKVLLSIEHAMHEEEERNLANWRLEP